MREIKFRAWDKEKKKLVNFDLFDNDENYLLCGDDSFHVKNDTPIMQFTGLLDKNGKEIYEGDIVKQFAEMGTELSGEIKYNQKAAAFLVRGCFEFQKNIEIIGNIYENPELIK